MDGRAGKRSTMGKKKKHSLCKNKQTYGDAVDAEICAADDEEERHLVAAWPTNGSCAGSACRGGGRFKWTGRRKSEEEKKKEKRMSQRTSFFFFLLGWKSSQRRLPGGGG